MSPLTPAQPFLHNCSSIFVGSRPDSSHFSHFTQNVDLFDNLIFVCPHPLGEGSVSSPSPPSLLLRRRSKDLQRFGSRLLFGRVSPCAAVFRPGNILGEYSLGNIPLEYSPGNIPRDYSPGIFTKEYSRNLPGKYFLGIYPREYSPGNIPWEYSAATIVFPEVVA